MSKVPPKLKAHVIFLLRKGSMRWKPRGDAQKKARVSRGLYTCNICKKAVRNKDKVVDHVEPVVPVETGFTTFDDYINRMFVEEHGWQVLCNACHDEKSRAEQEKRKIFRQERKKT